MKWFVEEIALIGLLSLIFKTGAEIGRWQRFRRTAPALPLLKIELGAFTAACAVVFIFRREAPGKCILLMAFSSSLMQSVVLT